MKHALSATTEIEFFFTQSICRWYKHFLIMQQNMLCIIKQYTPIKKRDKQVN